jgi:hypothetical protein
MGYFGHAAFAILILFIWIMLFCVAIGVSGVFSQLRVRRAVGELVLVIAAVGILLVFALLPNPGGSGFEAPHLWAICPLPIAMALFWMGLGLKPPPANRCNGCGYDLTGNESGVCPECGRRRERRAAQCSGDEASEIRRSDAAHSITARRTGSRSA